jgi:glycosyltransferase involved in cell wall biosynthesis
MHLLIVNQYGLPSGSPGITRHGDLGTELVQRGHQVTVVASRFHYLTRRDNRAESVDRDLTGGVRFVWLETGSYAANDHRRVRSMVSFTVRAFLKGLRIRPRPDVVLASSPHLLVGIAGKLLARWHGVPFVFEVRDLWPLALIDLGAVRRGSLTERLLLRLERWCYQWASRVVVVPPHAGRRLAEVGVDPAKAVHVPNFTTLDRLPREPLPPSLATIIERCAGRRIVLYAGAEGVSNGLRVVIDALGVLRERYPETYATLEVILIGDGAERGGLEAAARAAGHDNVQFHAPVPKAAILTALERATLLLVSFADAAVYDYGLSPNKLFDYLYAGRPVLLASRRRDTPVDAADAGRCYVPGAGESLAAAIHELLDLPDAARAEMGLRGRRLVEDAYTATMSGSRLEKLLMDVVAART